MDPTPSKIIGNTGRTGLPWKRSYSLLGSIFAACFYNMFKKYSLNFKKWLFTLQGLFLNRELLNYNTSFLLKPYDMFFMLELFWGGGATKWFGDPSFVLGISWADALLRAKLCILNCMLLFPLSMTVGTLQAIELGMHSPFGRFWYRLQNFVSPHSLAAWVVFFLWRHFVRHSD